MPYYDRRQVTKLLGTATGLSLLSTSTVTNFAYAKGKAKVVVIGGGAGGATLANKVKAAAPDFEVTLIEPKTTYTSCFFSNLYIGGLRTFTSLQHGYEGLSRLGVNLIHEKAIDVDSIKKTVTLESGKVITYDRLVLSPGIDIDYGSIEGYSHEASQVMPHAWQGGAQTKLLRTQLEAMDNGGTVVMAIPKNPYRCPPGPYERACMIAHYLKNHKQKSKLILFDAKTRFAKQPAFMEAFNGIYKNIIEVNLTDELTNNAVIRVDAKTGEIQTAEGRRERPAVANIIPQQRAGDIAKKAGCTQGDWCPVKPENMSSTKVPDIYVLGDASTATQMPKSAFSANSQAKVAASHLIESLNGKSTASDSYKNTCWSAIAPNNSIKIGARYTPGELHGKPALVAKDGFVSKPGEPAKLRKYTFNESFGWYATITDDIFAKQTKPL